MRQLVKQLKDLSPYDHFLVFLIILTILKTIDVFLDNGLKEGLHFLKLGAALFAISSILFFLFKYVSKKKKKYQHALISTFLILLMLSHADPDGVRGMLVIILLYVSKFFITYKKQPIFNPVVFAIGLTTLLALVIPAIGIPPLDFSGIDIRYSIAGILIPFALIPITLSLIFNVGRIRKHPLALSFIISSLMAGFALNVYGEAPFSYILSITFMGAAIIVEPKTAPHKMKVQLIYGIALAVITVGLYSLKVPNALVLGLMIANIVYFIFKQKKYN